MYITQALWLYLAPYNILLPQQYFLHALDHIHMLPVFVLSSDNAISDESVSLDGIASANWKLLN